MNEMSCIFIFIRFQANRYTGKVVVAECATPGSGNCIDKEQKDTYIVNFEAWDNYGEGLMASVKLTIHVIDDNDNTPTFALDQYVRYIDEGQTVPDPELKVVVSTSILHGSKLHWMTSWWLIHD